MSLTTLKVSRYCLGGSGKILYLNSARRLKAENCRKKIDQISQIAMNEKNDFALVRKPTSAVEKAAPGAKRILSGIVADALALAKPIFTVLIGDDQFGDLVETIIKSDWAQKYSLRFIRFKRESELLRSAQEQPFDLIFIYVGNVEWDTDDPFSRAVEVLERIKKQYGKPIVATQGMKMVIHAKFKNINLQMFQDAKEAWQELLRADPDLFITDDIMGGELNGKDFVQRLVNRKASFPTIMHFGDLSQSWVQENSDKTPNVTFLYRPFTMEQLYTEMSKHLGSRLQFQKEKL